MGQLIFGRAYALVVTPQAGPLAGTPIMVANSDNEPYALRFTFDITQSCYGPWQARVVIYNADGEVTAGTSKTTLYDAVLQEGDRVQVFAGYLSSYPAGTIPPLIFDGPLFYSVLGRENGVDKTLELNCILSRTLSTKNFVNQVIPKLATQLSAVRYIAEKSTSPIYVDNAQVSSVVSPMQMPRAQSFFGSPDTYLNQIASQNSAVSWFDSKKWNVASLANPVGDVKATYAPVQNDGTVPSVQDGVSYTLIGMPQQTQLGVDFRVLLDPSIQIAAPLPKVAVDTQYVRLSDLTYPLPEGSVLPRPLQGSYAVVGVRFTGDTRGEPWYSDFTTIAVAQDVISQLRTILSN